MPVSKLTRLSLPLVLFAMAGGLASAQTVSGVIRGSVVDSSSAAIPGAEATLVNIGTGTSVTALTSPENGLFVFPSVQSGRYTLRVRAQGFKNLAMTDIVIATSEMRDLGAIPLSVGDVAESVSVQDQVTPLQTASGERAGLVTGAQLNDLAIKGRDFFAFAKLIPGVVDFGGGRNAPSANAIGGISINGGRSEMKNFTVDGITSISQGSNNNQPFQPNMDTIAELKVLTSNFQAEYGRSAGGLISVITKSGTREFHGSGWWTHRHERFNGNDFFRNSSGLDRVPYRYNIAGFAIGGPAYIPKLFNKDKNKVFFFASQEYVLQRLDHGTRFVNMPTALERRGDFSRSVDTSGRLVAVRDPENNAPFPGNMIPANRQSAMGQAILNFFPAPNFQDPDASLVNNRNYRTSASAPYNRRNDMVRMDVYLTSKLYGYFRYIHDADEAEYPYQFYNFDYNAAVNKFPGKTKGGHLIYTISPRLLNDFSFGTWGGGNAWSSRFPEKSDRSVVGNIPQWFPNELSSDLPSEALDAKQMPTIQFGGTPVNPPSANPNGQAHANPGKNQEFTDNLSWVAGAHNIKTGFYLLYSSPRQYNGGQWNGILNFAVNANNPLNTGHAYANALLGNFNTYTESTRPVNFNTEFWQPEFFVQDNWRATRTLTLDVGVRFYRINPNRDKQLGFASFDPQLYVPSKAPRLYWPALQGSTRVGRDPVTGQIVPAALIGAYVPGTGDISNGMRVGGVDGYPPGLYTIGPLHIGPRFGFAWDIGGHGKNVVRGGVGRFFDRSRNLIPAPAANNPPVGYRPTAYYGDLRTFTQSGGFNAPSSLQFPFPGRDVKQPAVTSFSLSVQRQLPFRSMIDVAYVGSVSSHLVQARNLNPIAPGSRFSPANADPTLPGRPLPDNFFRPISGYGDLISTEFAGSSNYHSLQVSAQRRFTEGLGFGVAYTWAKALGVSNAWNDSISAYFSPRTWEYGPLDFDRSHSLAINFTYDLPKMGKSGSKRALAVVVNDWTLSGIASFVSGAPFTPSLATTAAVDITGATEAARISVVGPARLDKSEKSFQRNFRTEAFAVTPAGSFGNAGVGILRGPGINNWDLALNKAIPVGLGENRRLRFRAEFYNAFNHTQFSSLDTAGRFDPQGRQVNANFGAFTGSREARVISFALRFAF